MDSQIYKVEELSVQEHRALRSVWMGSANKDQQKMAISVIVKKLARYGDMTFVEGSQDGTAFLSGRAYVGSVLRRLVQEPVKDNNIAKPTPK